jgi:hypothetical protein
MIDSPKSKNSDDNKSPLQPPRIDRTQERHPDAPALRIPILLHLDPHLDFIKHRNRHRRSTPGRTRRRRHHDRIIVRIELHVPFERDQSFQSEPTKHAREQAETFSRRARHALEHKHPHAIPECPYDERVFRDALPWRGTARLGERLRTAFQRQTDVEFDAGASCHLRHPMPSIDHVHDALDVGFGVERRVERDVGDGSGELTVREDVCGVIEDDGQWEVRSVRVRCLRTSVSPDRTREMRVNRACEPVMSKGISGNASRAEILGRQHAPRRHDADQRIECRCRRILHRS